MIYRLLLLIFPASFRRRFGGDLTDAVADRVATARARGILATLVAGARAAADLIAHGVAERRAERRRGAGTRRQLMFQTIAQDVSYALRTFRARPGFTAVALITLALGIGANTAIFSVVHAVMLRDLPYPDGDRIVRLYATHRTADFDHGVMNPFDYDYVETRATALSAFSVLRQGQTTLTGAGDPVRLRTASAMPQFFEIMATRPTLGRPFTAIEADEGLRVTVISHRVWTSLLGQREDAVGETLLLDDEPVQVIGVMPAGFDFPAETDFWMPTALSAETRQVMNSWYLGTIGRLRDGVSFEDARAETDGLAAELEAAYPESRANRGFNLIGLRDDLALNAADGLKMLQGVVVFVLLIACANVANLLLAQTNSRQREFAVRAAVGGARGRLIRQALTESVVLAAGGAIVGVMVAVWGVGALVALAPDRLLPSAESIAVSWPVLAVTAAVATITGILFGLAPALFLSGRVATSALKDGARTAGGGLGWTRRQWLRSGLVAAEVALALVLLTGAGLLMRSFTGLLAQSPGFQPAGVLTAQVSLPAGRYPDADQRYRFWSELVERLDALPGVTNAGASNALPFTFWEWQSGFVVRGREDAPAGTGVRTVTPGAFETLGIPLLAGRGFSDEDSPESEGVVVVSDAFAREFLPGVDPVGQQIAFSPTNPSYVTIVGVVGSIRHMGLDETPRVDVYRPFAQDRDKTTMLLALKTSGDPAMLADAMRGVVATLDPALPVQSVSTMNALIGDRLAERTFYLTLLGLFAGLAAALAATGIYGVMAYVVSQGRREFGIRLALGAQPRRLRLSLVRQGLAVVAIGAAVGVIGARWLSQLVEAQLFEVSATDGASYAAAAIALLLVAGLACWIPTGRAAAVSPVEALRD